MMALIVEMIHRKEDCDKPLSFSLNGESWKRLLTLAQTFGWKPSGTVPADSPSETSAEYLKFFKPNYEPEEWAYCKAVTKEDASNIAVALLAAYDNIKSGKVVLMSKERPAIFADEISEQEFQSISGSIEKIILEFGFFASQGGFLFAWDD